MGIMRTRLEIFKDHEIAPVGPIISGTPVFLSTSFVAYALLLSLRR
jgi:hypothetical protein